MDVCARGLIIAEKMLREGRHTDFLADRYGAWRSSMGEEILQGHSSLEALATQVLHTNRDQLPVSGRQEYVENMINRYC